MIKLGAQLFTTRAYIGNERDFARTISKVAKMGYNTVQISGVNNFNAEEYRKICDAHGVEIALTHTDKDKVMNNIDKVIEEHKIMGCNYVGLGGGIPGTYLNPGWIEYLQEDFMPILEKLHANGMKLMVHNHSHEFIKREDGKDVFDLVMERFPEELVGFTLDTCWAQAAGADVVQTIHRLKGRLDCVHLKDFKRVVHDVKYMEVGNGNMNFPPILAAFEEVGTKYMFVEQDECDGSPFQVLETSYNNLKAMGYK